MKLINHTREIKPKKNNIQEYLAQNGNRKSEIE